MGSSYSYFSDEELERKKRKLQTLPTDNFDFPKGPMGPTNTLGDFPKGPTGPTNQSVS